MNSLFVCSSRSVVNERLYFIDLIMCCAAHKAWIPLFSPICWLYLLCTLTLSPFCQAPINLNSSLHFRGRKKKEIGHHSFFSFLFLFLFNAVLVRVQNVNLTAEILSLDYCIYGFLMCRGVSQFQNSASALPSTTVRGSCFILGVL